MLTDDWIDRCKVTHYCSKSHQKVDWKTHKQQCPPLSSPAHTSAALAAASDTSTLFPEFSIIVEAEDQDEDDTDPSSSSSTAAAAATAVAAAATAYGNGVVDTGGGDDGRDDDDDGEDEDVRLRQADYSAALGVEIVDPVYVEFLSRSGKKAVPTRQCQAGRRSVRQSSG